MEKNEDDDKLKQAEESGSQSGAREQLQEKKLVALQQQVKGLIQQNKTLGGKIRGYQTLGQLLQDSRRKCKEKDQEINTLQELMKNFSDGAFTESVLESQYGATTHNTEVKGKLSLSEGLPKIEDTSLQDASHTGSEKGKEAASKPSDTPPTSPKDASPRSQSRSRSSCSFSILSGSAPSSRRVSENERVSGNANKGRGSNIQVMDGTHDDDGKRNLSESWVLPSPTDAEKDGSLGRYDTIRTPDGSRKHTDDVDDEISQAEEAARDEGKEHKAGDVSTENAAKVQRLQPRQRKQSGQEDSEEEGVHQTLSTPSHPDQGLSSTLSHVNHLNNDDRLEHMDIDLYSKDPEKGTRGGNSLGGSPAPYSGSMTLPSLESEAVSSGKGGFMSNHNQSHTQVLTTTISLEQDQQRLFEAVGVNAVSLRDSELAVELTRNAARVMRIEKQSQIMKTLIDSLTKENEYLKSQLSSLIAEKDHFIKQQEQEISQLRKKIRKLELERNHVSPTPSLHSEAPTSFMAEGERQDPGSHLLTKSVDQGYVAVETQQQAEKSASEKRQQKAETAAREEIVESYEKKIKKMERRIQKLQEANSAWDEHCRRLEKQYKEHMKTVNTELSTQKEKVTELQRQEDQKVGELQRKIQEERINWEQIQKEQNDVRLQLCTADDRASAFKQQAERERHRANALDTKVIELQSMVQGQRDVIDALNSDVRSMRIQSITTTSTGPVKTVATEVIRFGKMSRDELIMEIQLLQQQVAVCTEDFERERQDRARAQTEKDSVSNRLRRKAEDLAKLNTEYGKVQTEADHLERENETLKRRLARKIEEYNQLERRHHHQPPPPPPLQLTSHIVPQPSNDRFNIWIDDKPLKQVVQNLTTRGSTQTITTSSAAATSTGTHRNIREPAYERHVPGHQSTELLLPPFPSEPVQWNVPAAASGPALPPTWNCPACTFINQGHINYCEMCEEPNPDSNEPINLGLPASHNYQRGHHQHHHHHNQWRDGDVECDAAVRNKTESRRNQHHQQ